MKTKLHFGVHAVKRILNGGAASGSDAGGNAARVVRRMAQGMCREAQRQLPTTALDR